MKSLLLGGGVNSILWTSGGHTHGFLRINLILEIVDELDMAC
jgi:hypothetical protein